MKGSRAFSLLEVMVAVAILLLIGALVIVPAYVRYASARGADDAATTLAQDIALLEVAAQNAGPSGGAELRIVSAAPLAYQGVQQTRNPDGSLGTNNVVERNFPKAALDGSAPIGPGQPLVFFSNGSAGYRASGVWVNRHQTLVLSLVSNSGGGATDLQLQLFTGAVSLARR